MDGLSLEPGIDNDNEAGINANEKVRLSIFGLGYVGAVSAACFADRGHTILGVDPDPSKIDAINAGQSPIVEEGLGDLLTEGISTDKIHATPDPVFAVLQSDVTFVCVGTPSAPDGSCDLKYLKQVSYDIGKALKISNNHHTIVFRSTVPPGTTAKVMRPIIEHASGKKAGVDFGLGFHPEFLRESTAIADFYDPPKTVAGGLDQRTRHVIASLYRGIDDGVLLTTLEAAEMVKYVDNTWHALKVSFANEIGNVCQACGVDSHDVMDIFVQDTKLNLSPYYMKPGFAFGGSCLPKDVRGITHLASKLGVDTPVLNSIIHSNDAQIDHAVSLIKQTAPTSVAFLGITFKAGTDDLRESPILTTIEKTLAEGIDVRIYDPNLNLETSVRHHLQHSMHDGLSANDLMARLPELVCDSAGMACDNADTIVVSHSDPLFRHIIKSRAHGQNVVDLVRLFAKDQSWLKMADAGMDDYVQKPSRAATLLAKLDLWVPQGNQRQLSILVAEDDPAMAAVIKASLTKAGHMVRHVGDGFQAIRAFRDNMFDAVFMDVSMPEMDGIEATKRIRALPGELACTPIIALTAHAAPEESETYAGICW